MGSDIASISFWLYFIYFFISIGVAFYIPGSLLLSRIPLTSKQRIVLSTVIGMAMWTLQGFIFGYSGLRFLSYVYVGIFLLLWIISQIRSRKKIRISFQVDRFDWLSFLILSIGVVIQLSGVWLMDTKIAKGLLMCCGHVPDNNLELALTNEIVHRFPPFEPGMFGVLVQNYHYWSHLLVGDLVRVFGLPLVATEYQYMSLIISAGLGLSAIVLSELLSMKKVFIRWFLFFLYFSGELTYVTIFFITGKLDLSVGSIENSAQFLMNYPRAVAIIILMGALSLLILSVKRKSISLWYIFCLICGTLIGFKVYVGIFALTGLSALFIYYFFARRFVKLIPIILAFIISLIIYLPVNYGAGGIFYSGAWRVENFAQIKQFNLGSSIMALEVYKQHNNILRIVEYYILFFVLFVVSSFGFKILGVLQNKKTLAKTPKELHIFLVTAIAGSFILGTFFLQKIANSNTFNFLVTVIIFGSFYTALSVSYFFSSLKSKVIVILLSFVIICISVPRIMYMEYENIRLLSTSGYILSNDELSALSFLRYSTPKNSLVLVDPSLYLLDYYAPYVSYLADRPAYYSGILNELQEHSIDFSGRQKIVDTIFNNTDEKTVVNQLKESGVSYILLAHTGKLAVIENNVTTEVFRNKNFRILKVK